MQASPWPGETAYACTETGKFGYYHPTTYAFVAINAGNVLPNCVGLAAHPLTGSPSPPRPPHPATVVTNGLGSAVLHTPGAASEPTEA